MLVTFPLVVLWFVDCSPTGVSRSRSKASALRLLNPLLENLDRGVCTRYQYFEARYPMGASWVCGNRSFLVQAFGFAATFHRLSSYEAVGRLGTGRQVYGSAPATIAVKLSPASASVLLFLPECKPLAPGGQCCSGHTSVPSAQRNAQR
jgi:hypothetical protein